MPPPAHPARGRLAAAWLRTGVLGLLAGLASAQAEGEQAAEAPGAAAGPTRGILAEATGRADYRIQARVEEGEGDTRRLSGSLTLVYRHPGPEPTRELWFHLYHNAFANNRSAHLAPLAGKLGDATLESGFGWQRVVKARALDTDLMPSFRYRGERGAPDEDAPEDRTVFTLELPRELQAGESVSVELAWEALVPRVRRRTGHKGDFFLMAHWFPKLGVFEPGRGWVCHPFYSNTEFYADYGTYDVTLDLPEAYAGAGRDAKVGASGIPIGPGSKSDGRFVTRFLAPSESDRATPDATGRLPRVHGFAWTADPDFVVGGGSFRAQDWMARFPDEVELARKALGPDSLRSLRDVEVVVLVQPEHAEQAERHFEATCAALFFYGLWYGGYPYERVTVVDPAWGARAAGGMEYPTLFTAGTRMFTTPDMHTPESVTVHECGHQFWYGLVGNDEFEASWLDEGLNSYTDSEVLFRVWGLEQRTTAFASLPFHGVALAPRPGERGDRIASSLAGRRLSILGHDLAPLRASGFLDWWRDQPLLAFTRQQDDPRWHDRVRYLAAPDVDRIDTPAFHYVDRGSYVVNSYPRTAIALRTLRGLVGDEAFLRGMRLFSERWRYGHPYPQDFFDAFLEGSQADVGWYLEDVFRGTATVDWSVEVSQRRRPSARGWFQAEPGAPFVEVEPDEQQAAREAAEQEEGATLAAESEPEADARAWEVDLVLRRKGSLALPLELELRWADGTRERRTWTREAQLASSWWRPLGEAFAQSSTKLEAVVLDPERRIYFDLDLSDNQWYDADAHLVPLRFAERALTQYAHALFWYGGLGG